MWTQSQQPAFTPPDGFSVVGPPPDALAAPTTHRLNLSARLEDIRVVRQALLRACGALGVDSDAAGDFALAVSEAFSNAIRHGTASADTCVETLIHLTAEAGVVELRYPGDPFPLDAPRLPDGTSTSGRGRYLMSILADQVGYEFAGGMTRIELRKRWP